jgi:bifunctional isochorismate lyase/aryl carrier protein
MMTAAEAFMHDNQPFLVGDALGYISRAEHEMALGWVAGRCGVVTDTAATVAALAPAPAGALPDSLAALRAQVAALLEMPPSDLPSEENLLDAGLDSIRLMSLLERWRAGGAELDFVALAGQPTLAHWWQLLNRVKAR